MIEIVHLHVRDGVIYRLWQTMCGLHPGKTKTFKSVPAKMGLSYNCFS